MIDFSLYLPHFEPVFSVVPALIAGGASLLGGLFSGIFNSSSQSSANYANLRAVQEQNKGNMELAEYQYNKNLEQWNRQNEYNDPSAQMERYRKAGLNPNLAIGNAGNAASSPQYTAPALERATVNPVSSPALGAVNALSPAITAYQNMRLQEEQIKAAKNENSRNSLRNSLLSVRYQQALQNYLFGQRTFDDRAGVYSWRREQLKGDVMLQKDRSDLLRYQLDKLYPAQYKLMRSLNNMRKHQGTILKHQADLWEQGINPNDPTWLRMIGTIFGDSIKGAMEWLGDLAPKFPSSKK